MPRAPKAAMDVEVATTLPDAVDVMAFAVFEPVGELPALDLRLRQLAATGDVSGKAGATSVVHREDGVRIVAAGAGSRNDADEDSLRDAAAGVARLHIGGTVAWLLDEGLEIPLGAQARAIVDGLVLGSYDEGRWKTSQERVRSFERLILVGGSQETLEIAERAERVGRWTNRARDLVNRAPNDLTPERLGERATELAEQFPTLSTEVLGRTDILALGMGAFAAVAQGSHNPARLIILRYEPAKPRRDVVVGLVGKAITFDSGGISIKPARSMEDMKGDMAGGAAVIEGLGLLADLNIPVRAAGVVAATENMVGGGSYRPGDILTAMNGKTIEVTNTDAEGRLVLADALWYCRQLGATHMVDFATLTGEMVVALGDFYAGVFGNDDRWRDLVVAAGEASGDHAWPWPLHRRYRRYVDSSFADMKNSGGLRQGSPVNAAEFLKEFVGDGPWAHVDMAGTGFLTRSRGDYLTQRGGTGYGVRLIAELTSRLADES